MKKIGISADLEKRIRSGQIAGPALRDEIVTLLDEIERKRETGSKDSAATGLGYKELVSLFRFHLGDALILPISKPDGWYIKMVALAKNKGVTKDNVEQICAGLRRGYRPPYRFEWVIGTADIHFAAGKAQGDGSAPGGAGHFGGSPSPVHTGREHLDDDPGE